MVNKVSRYIGIDLGHKNLYACILEEKSDEPVFIECSVKEQDIKKRLCKVLNSDDIVVIETGTLSFWFKDVLEKYVGCKVLVLNANRLRIIYDSLKKTDKADSEKLAILAKRFRQSELPLVEAPSEKQQLLRKLCAERSHLIKNYVSERLRFYNLCIENGVTDVRKKDFRNSKAMMSARDRLPESAQATASRIILAARLIERGLLALERECKLAIEEYSSISSLYCSMPGIGPITSMSIIAYADNFSKFSKASQVSMYFGLVPRVDNSGQTIRHGHIVHQCNKYLRSLIIQAAWALVRSKNGGVLKLYFENLSIRIGRKKAIVATARKMVETLFAMSKTGELYRTAC